MSVVVAEADMNNSAWAILFGIGVFACTSTDIPIATGGADGGGGQSGTGGYGGSPTCDESICEGRTFMGQTLATCCFSERGCGVILDGACIAPITIADRDARSPSPFGAGEPVVLDPSCPDRTFTMGATIQLKGCCDPSGVCGSSTEALAASGAPIPKMCITPKEATRFGQRAEAGADITCRYPTDAGLPVDASTRD
jgi:hypothetical protein